jgi:peptidyl-prolyl cis-trans isomerase A (cyclophilin A)
MRAHLFLLAALVLAGCASDPAGPPDTQTGELCETKLPALDAAWKAERPRVRIETSAGTFDVELAMEDAPITTANFLKLVRDGTYDGTLFHRVVKDFVIQGGDPLSKDDYPSNDGTGGTDPIPDEFNAGLRHDGIGVLSMANAGPNTGTSQFFVTLGATPHLDDRHSVFGRVVEGLEVVRSIGTVQTDSDQRPLEPITLIKASLLDATPFEKRTGAGVHVVVKEKKAEPGRAVKFAVILRNTGNVRDAMAVTATTPAGWICKADGATIVPANDSRVVFLSLTPPARAAGTTDISVQAVAASGANATTTTKVTLAALGREVEQGDKVTANYAGILLDGRLFDTSMQAVGTDAEQPKFATVGGWREKTSYSSFPFTVGSGVIPGFTNLAKTAKAGETVTALIPQKDAYATGTASPYERPLTGRDLIFELEILTVS